MYKLRRLLRTAYLFMRCEYLLWIFYSVVHSSVSNNCPSALFSCFDAAQMALANDYRQSAQRRKLLHCPYTNIKYWNVSLHWDSWISGLNRDEIHIDWNPTLYEVLDKGYRDVTFGEVQSYFPSRYLDCSAVRLSSNGNIPVGTGFASERGLHPKEYGFQWEQVMNIPGGVWIMQVLVINALLGTESPCELPWSRLSSCQSLLVVRSDMSS